MGLGVRGDKRSSRVRRWLRMEPIEERLRAISERVDMYRDEYLSRIKFRLAVDAGLILRPAVCERCGESCKPSGHHEDYSTPFVVEWLCSKCHAIANGRRLDGVRTVKRVEIDRIIEGVKERNRIRLR